MRGDECLNYQSFYLRIVEQQTGENAILKYNLSKNDIEIYDDFGEINIQKEGQDDDPYLRVFPSSSFKTYTIKLRNTDIGKIKLSNRNKETSACCTSIEIVTIKSVSSNLNIEEKTQEPRQPFYEVQYR
jgi:hypothetical protein